MLFRRRRRDDEEDEPRRKPDRSWPTRLAWLVLVGGTGAVLVRASVATVIVVHGDGMAPGILDGDSVLLMRGELSIERGDIVVYDPVLSPAEAADPSPPQLPEHGSGQEQSPYVNPTQDAASELRNTAVVDVDDVENNWQRVQDKASAQPARSFRVARVLAVPGDRVTFNVPDAALGLVIDGSPLSQKPAEAKRLRMAGKPEPGEEPTRDTRIFATAYEWSSGSRYAVLASTEPVRWPGMTLPGESGPMEIRAPGYLVLADNRDEGACCDSRRLGWIPAESIRGELVMKLAGNPHATPDVDPRARRFQWLP